MMYPYLILNDDTEIVHSEMKPDGRVKVYIETPDEKDGFHSATCYLSAIPQQLPLPVMRIHGRRCSKLLQTADSHSSGPQKKIGQLFPFIRPAAQSYGLKDPGIGTEPVYEPFSGQHSHKAASMPLLQGGCIGLRVKAGPPQAKSTAK